MKRFLGDQLCRKFHLTFYVLVYSNFIPRMPEVFSLAFAASPLNFVAPNKKKTSGPQGIILSGAIAEYRAHFEGQKFLAPVVPQ